MNVNKAAKQFKKELEEIDKPNLTFKKISKMITKVLNKKEGIDKKIIKQDCCDDALTKGLEKIIPIEHCECKEEIDDKSLSSSQEIKVGAKSKRDTKHDEPKNPKEETKDNNINQQDIGKENTNHMEDEIRFERKS